VGTEGETSVMKKLSKFEEFLITRVRSLSESERLGIESDIEMILDEQDILKVTDVVLEALKDLLRDPN
jgi:hypothetical protein